MQNSMIQKYSLLGFVTMEAEWWVPGLWPQHTASAFSWPVQTHPECSSKTFIAIYQTIRCPNPHYIMNPHNLEYIKSCAKDYLEYRMHRRKCHTRKTGLQNSSMFSTNTVLKIMYFSHNKLRKQNLKYFLITDITCINTHFGFKTTCGEFQKIYYNSTTRRITHSKQPL
jgi:hypothetical protein